MRKRIAHWLAAAAFALALGAGLLTGGTTTPVVYGSEPTPTPTPLDTNSNPGGSGGGGG